MKKHFRTLIISIIAISMLIILASCTETPVEGGIGETTNSAVVNTTNGQTEESSVADNTEPEGVGGQDRDCYIHCAQFHRAIDLLTGSLNDSLVSSEKLDEWAGPLRESQTSLNDECLVNLSTFLEHFNISRKTLQKFIDDNYEQFLESEINLDVLYSGDKALIDKYYSIENEELYRQRGLERYSKYYGEKIMELQNVVNKNVETSSSYHDIWTFESFLYPGGYDTVYYWMKEFVDAGQYDKVNIVEYSKRFEITKVAFEEHVEKNNLGIYADYNADVIFSEDQESIAEYYSIENEEVQKAQIKANYDQYVKQNGKPSSNRTAKWEQ